MIVFFFSFFFFGCNLKIAEWIDADDDAIRFLHSAFFANNTSGAEAFYGLVNVELDWVSKKNQNKTEEED